MSQEIKNALNSFAYETVKTMMKAGVPVTPEILDGWEAELHGTMKENGQKIGKARIRELLVCYIIDEFDIAAFGLEPPRPKKEISENCIKKMKAQRKKGFDKIKVK